MRDVSAEHEASAALRLQREDLQLRLQTPEALSESAGPAGPVGAWGRLLQLLAEGMRNEGIATKLFISPQTVQTHVRNILGKLRVHSKLEAVAFALLELLALLHLLREPAEHAQRHRDGEDGEQRDGRRDHGECDLPRAVDRRRRQFARGYGVRESIAGGRACRPGRGHVRTATTSTSRPRT